MNQQFRVPEYVSKCLIMLDSTGDIDYAVDINDTSSLVFKLDELLAIRGTRVGYTGANRIWSAGSAIMVALAREDTTWLKRAADNVWDEIKFKTRVYDHLLTKSKIRLYFFYLP